MKKTLSIVLSFLLLAGCSADTSTTTSKSYDIDSIPEYSGDLYVHLNDNEPTFTDDEIQEAKSEFKEFSELDSLGRCGTARGSLSIDTMPQDNEERGNISEIKPTGWHTIQYDFVDGKSLYNRCHLLAWKLSDENANPENLITGTRTFNAVGMLQFENEVIEYIEETQDRVLYEVTPVFEDDNLVATGVQMQACSVSDHCESISYNVFIYNVEDGVEIDYATGDAHLTQEASASYEDQEEQEYVLNTRSKKIHLPDCEGAENMSKYNRKEVTDTLLSLEEQGYSPDYYCIH